MKHVVCSVEENAFRRYLPCLYRFLPVLLFTSLLPSSALAHVAAHDEFSVALFKPDDGVPSDYVTSFAQGPDGFLWMLSDKTLARYDGFRFLDVDVERFVSAAAERNGFFRRTGRLFTSPSGTVWLSTSAGDLWRWTGREFESWFPQNTSNRAFVSVFEISPDEVLAIARNGRLMRGKRNEVAAIGDLTGNVRPQVDSFVRDAAGAVWCITDGGGIVRADARGKVDQPFAKDHSGIKASAVTSDRSGTIWVGAASGLFAWRNDQFEPLASPNPVEPFPVQAVLASPTGGLWVASRGQVWFYTEERWAGPMGDWPEQTPPHARLVDSSGRLWLGPPQKGLWCFTPGGKTTQLGPETGIQADAMALFCDREGTVWVSVYRTGVARVRNRLFTSVKVTAGLHTTPLWNVTEDGAGAIWFSPEFKSPVRWRESEEKEFALPSSASEPGMWTKAMTVDRSGAVWAAIYGAGILRAENDAFHPALPWPRQARFARALYQDKSTNWWLGSDSGLHSWSDNRWRHWDSAAGLPNVPVRAVTEDSFGRLWVATFGGGVARLDEGRFTRFNRRHGIPNNLIYTVHGGADGSVWIGTHGGLARARNGRITSYTTLHGLPDNRVVQVLEDGRGFLWIGTRNGLCRIAITSINAFDRGSVKTLDCLVFDRYDDLPTAVFQDRSAPGCWRARDGKLWFVTAAAAIACQPDQITRNDVAPPVIIEDVIVDNRPLAVHSDDASGALDGLGVFAIGAPSRVELSPGPHAVEIRYTAPSLAVPGKVRYEYQLEGLDTEWIKAGTARSVLYSFLPPGDYRFRVRACNSDGKWNETGAELAITVQPSLWQAKSFPWLLAAVFAAITGGGVAMFQRARTRRRLARLELQRTRDIERARISRDLHDHLGASLTEISMLADDAADAAVAIAPKVGQFRVISEKVSSVVNELDAMVWAVDPKKDTTASLAGYLGSFVQEYVASSGLDCRVNVPHEILDRALSSEVRHNLFLAVKETVNNAIRHAHATEIAFTFTYDDDTVEIVVADNGIGFDPLVAASGNGLSNVSNRLSGIGGRCEISSKPGGGTTVLLVYHLVPEFAVL